jgi:hypothetical protein
LTQGRLGSTIASSRVGGYTVSNPVLVLAFAGPLIGPSILLADAPAQQIAPKGERWTEVRLAELQAKDTDKINVITAGEAQKSSLDQCSAAADVTLCRILVSAVNVAAILGTSFPTK